MGHTLPLDTIMHGDCLDVLRSLPTASVDAIVTDPPYCSGGFVESAKRQAKGQGARSENLRRDGWFINDNMGTAGLVWLLRQMACEAYRLLKDGGSLCVFTDWRMVANLGPALESSGLRWQNLLVWDKGSMGLGFGFRPRHEMILHFVKGTGQFHDNHIGNVIACPRVPTAKRQHQTEKPVPILRQLCRVVCPPGGTVLDPFAGSGSTGVAAIAEGMRFIGVERGEAYVRVAAARIDEMQQSPSLWESEVSA